MKNRFTRFLMIYLVFILCAFLINLMLEIFLRFVVRIPEPLDILGIMVFFLIFNLAGAIILFYKNFNAKMMGVLSLVFGQILEFSFMKPEWVLEFYALNISGETIAPFIISSVIYWFPAWAIPSYMIHKYLSNIKSI